MAAFSFINNENTCSQRHRKGKVAGKMNIHRCHATILFADLSSSTKIGEALDPELVAEVLGRLRKVAEEVISKHGGIVNQFYGDGVLAAFGFPEPQEDGAIRAITAALELHEAAACILPLPGIELPGMEIKLHSGIHSGLVAVQEGDHIQGRYKLTGDALNTAARLSDYANPNELLVSADTFEGLKPYFDSDGIRTLKLKGKQAPVDAYKVKNRSSVRTRYGASVSRGLSTFVGRTNELTLLEDDMQSIQSDGALFLEFCGDPGVGKTRLCEEYIGKLNPNELQVFRAYCVNSERGKPLHPFIQVMQAAFQLDQESCKKTAQHVVQQATHNTELDRYTEVYLRLLNLSDSDESIPQAELLNLSVNATSALLQHLCNQSTVLLYLDDWHAADEISQKALVNILTHCRDLPLLVLMATRTAMPELKYLRGRTVNMQPFDLSMSNKLIASFFGKQLSLNFTTSVHQQSGGNALFIEELCLSLPRNKMIESVHQRSEVPTTLQGLIAKRVNQLPDDICALVKIAAVLGNMFPLWLFKAMAGEQLTEAQLDTLSELDLIRSGGREGMLRFKHGITREVCYDQVSLMERRRLHGRACEILEGKTKEAKSDLYVELLAYHYFEANNPFQAGWYAEKAADKAIATLALDRAGEHLKCALTALDPVTCEGSSYFRWKGIIEKFAWVMVYDPVPEQLPIFQRSLELAKAFHDAEGISKSEYWLGYLKYTIGQPKPAVDHCLRAIDISQQINNQPLLVETYALLGQTYGSSAQYNDAFNYFDLALQKKSDYRKSKRPSLGSAYSLACKAQMLGDMGRFDEAYDCFDSALQTLNGRNHQVEGSIYGLYSSVKIWQGNWEDGKRFGERAQKVAQSTSSSYIFSIYRALTEYSNWMLTGEGKYLAAILSNTHGMELRGKMSYFSLNYGWLAETLVHKKRWQQARKYAGRALMRTRQGDRLGEAMTYRALAEMASAHNAPKRVEHYMKLAMESAEARQSRHELANNQFLQAKLAMKHNQFDRASYYLEQARIHFQEMGMAWHDEQAAALSSLHSITA